MLTKDNYTFLAAMLDLLSPCATSSYIQNTEWAILIILIYKWTLQISLFTKTYTDMHVYGPNNNISPDALRYRLYDALRYRYSKVFVSNNLTLILNLRSQLTTSIWQTPITFTNLCTITFTNLCTCHCHLAYDSCYSMYINMRQWWKYQIVWISTRNTGACDYWVTFTKTKLLIELIHYRKLVKDDNFNLNFMNTNNNL